MVVLRRSPVAMVVAFVLLGSTAGGAGAALATAPAPKASKALSCRSDQRGKNGHCVASRGRGSGVSVFDLLFGAR